MLHKRLKVYNKAFKSKKLADMLIIHVDEEAERFTVYSDENPVGYRIFSLPFRYLDIKSDDAELKITNTRNLEDKIKEYQNELKNDLKLKFKRLIDTYAMDSELEEFINELSVSLKPFDPYAFVVQGKIREELIELNRLLTIFQTELNKN